MPRGDYIWFDGKILPWNEAKVHVMIHALHYGSAVIEGIRCYFDGSKTCVFRLDDHLRRFIRSMEIIGMKPRYSVDVLRDAVIQVVKYNRLRDGYIRPIAFYNMDDYLGIDLSNYSDKYSIAIGGWDWGKYLGEAYRKGSRVKICRWRRISRLSVPLEAKVSGYYANNIIARLEAGGEYDEVIMLDEHGYVAEGSGENIFIVKDGVIYTPSIESSILPGITRDTVIKLARDILGIQVIEKQMQPNELYRADEVFMVGTAAEVTPVIEIDGIQIGGGRPGRVTRKLQEIYENVVRGRYNEYKHWITYVNV